MADIDLLVELDAELKKAYELNKEEYKDNLFKNLCLENGMIVTHLQLVPFSIPVRLQDSTMTRRWLTNSTPV